MTPVHTFGLLVPFLMAGKSKVVSSQVVIDLSNEDLSEMCRGALEVVKWSLFSGSSKNEVGIYLVGTEETKNASYDAYHDEEQGGGGYEHVYQLAKLRRVSFDVIDRLRRRDLPRGGAGGSIVDAIFAAKEEIERRTATIRRIVVFTRRDEVDADLMKKLLVKMKRDRVELWCFGCEGPAWRQGCRMTGGLCRRDWSLVKNCLSERSELFEPRYQSISIDICGIRIDCKKANVVAREGLPAPSQESIPAMNYLKRRKEEEEEDPGKVVKETRYAIVKKLGEDDEDDRVEREIVEDLALSRDQIAKVYAYGTDRVSLENLLDEDDDEKGVIVVLKCVPAIPAQWTLGKPPVALRGGTDERARCALSSFSNALREKDACAIARWGQHKLFALFPLDCGLLAKQIPFMDDRIPFSHSAKEIPKSLQSAADALVSARSLRKEECLAVANPSRSRFLDLVVKKAVVAGGDTPSSSSSDIELEDAMLHARRSVNHSYRFVEEDYQAADVAWREAVNSTNETKKSVEKTSPKKSWEDHVREQRAAAAKEEEGTGKENETVRISTADPVKDFKRYLSVGDGSVAREKMRMVVRDLLSLAEEDDDAELFEKAADCVVALEEYNGIGEEFREFVKTKRHENEDFDLALSK